MGPGFRRDDVSVRWDDVGDLRVQFDPRFQEADHAGDVEEWVVGEDGGVSSVFGFFGEEIFGYGSGVFCGYAVDDGAGEVSEEEVAGDGFVKHVEGDPVALDAGFGAGGGDEAGVVGVVVVDVDDSVDASVDEMCEEELHVSSFVAAECEARSVVAFDEELRDGAFVGIWVGVHRIGDGGSESRHFLEGGVEARQFDAWEGVDAV